MWIAIIVHFLAPDPSVDLAQIQFSVSQCSLYHYLGKENNTQYSIAHVCVLMFDYARKDKVTIQTFKY